MEIQYRIDLNLLLEYYGMLDKPVAEIGVAEGRFALDIAGWGVPKIYLVDVWETKPEIKGDASMSQQWHDANFKEVQDKFSSYGDKIVLLKGLSVDMAKLVPDGSLGLVYLDAGHHYDAVFADLSTWFPKLMTGGIMAGHDFISERYEVKRAVENFCSGRFEIHVIPELSKEDAGFWFQKT